MGDQSEKTVYKWLGISHFDNKMRDIKEEVVQYILRHTRRIPRDVITLGNLLCQETQRVKWYPDVYTIDEALGIATRFAAKKIGTEQLAICANHIYTDQGFEIIKTQRNRFSTYLGNDEYKRSLVDDLKDFIFSFRKDRFSVGMLKKNQAKAHEIFGQSSNIYNVLWLNGILGYVNNHRDDCVTFYIENRVADFKFPLNKRYYAFHSCVTDCVGLKPVGKPVVQCQ
jgi:hypothetical protein